MKKTLSWFTVVEKDENRVFGLDLLRAVAILLVLIAHGKVFLMPFSGRAGVFKIGGAFGVELFFVLSGYLIGTILIKIYNKTDSFNFSTIKNFWLRRWFRTLPNYYLALLINILLLFLFTGETFFPSSYFIFTQSLNRVKPGEFFGESWSLTVEEWFYLLFPLCLFGFILLLRRARKKRVLLMSILSFFFAIFILRLVMVITLNPPWDAGLRQVTQVRLDSIIFGVLFAYIAYYHKELWKAKANLLAITGVCLTLFSAYYFFRILKNESFAINLFSKTFYFTLLSFGFACLLPKASLITSVKNTFLTRFIVHTSLISYSLYLYHSGIIIGTFLNFHKPDQSLTTILCYFGFWICSYILCTIIYKYFEKPCTNIRDRFSGKKTPVTYDVKETHTHYGPLIKSEVDAIINK